MRRTIFTISSVAIFSLLGCSAVQDTGEMLGFGGTNREALMAKVEDARETQVAAKAHLHETLASLRRVETVVPTELDSLHGELEDRISDTEGELADLRGDMSSVRETSNDLFTEWQADLAKYESEDLRRQSRQELQRTRQNVKELMATLGRTAQSLESTIPMMKDQLLYIEHHMNAGTTPEPTPSLNQTRERISSLIEELEGSIKSTQKFVDEGVAAEA